mmetsp:Transcript_23773/g.66831  ORF Transcript_23773/g.66831 Transcript_23773/m.66831 type:complete len:414 (+) Transcript_23773:139-1380(+)
MGQSFSRRTPSIKEARQSHDVKQTHRALLSDDVVFLLLSQLAPWDGSGAAAACKVWRSHWKRRCAGLLRLARHRVGAYEWCNHVVAKPGGGVIVSNYHESRLEIFSPEGESQGAFVAGVSPFDTPGAVALLGDERNTAWIICEDNQNLVCVQLGDAMGEDKFLEPSDQIVSPTMDYICPKDLALSPGGEFLLAIVNDWVGEVLVLNSRDGTIVGSFGFEEDDTFGNLHSPRGLAVQGDYCFVADTYNQRVSVFNWRSQTWVRCFGRRGAFLHHRTWTSDPEIPHPYWFDSEMSNGDAEYEDERKGTGPGEFIEPVGVAVHGNTLYVSELVGRRIQVMRLPENILDLSSEPQVLQIIPAPGGQRLGGLCVDGERLWCAGPLSIYTELGKPPKYTYVSLFSPFSGDEQGPRPRAA